MSSDIESAKRREQEAEKKRQRRLVGAALGGGANKNPYELAQSPYIDAPEFPPGILPERPLQLHNFAGSQYADGAGNRRKRSYHRRVDARKELIAILKAKHPGALARKICELIDRTINSTPIRRDSLAPLDSWRKLAPSERSWVGFYHTVKTRNQVRAYVNKVPPLKTARAKSSR